MTLNAKGGIGRYNPDETYIPTLRGSFDLPEVVGTLSDGAHMGGGLTGKTLTRVESSHVAHCVASHYAKGGDPTTDNYLVVGGGFDQPIGMDEEQNCVVDGFGCLKSREKGGGFEGTVAYRTAGDGAVFEEGDRTAPLTTATDPSANIIAFSAKDHGADAMEDCSPTLRAGGHDKSHANSGNWAAVTVNFRGREEGTQAELGDEVATAVRAGGGTSSKSHAMVGMAVRRLTPRECERLQGFEDDYTLVPYRGKPASDGPRYKAIGKSWAVPVLEWIGRRVQILDSREEGQ